MKRHGIFPFIVICVCAAPAQADCTSGSLLATCIDADTFWPHAGPSTFAFVAATDVTQPGRLGAGMVTTYLQRPIVLLAPSADPTGNAVDAVGHVVDSTFLWSYGLASRADLFAAVSTVSYRTGTGISSIASQTTHELPHTALRDTRVGGSYALVPHAGSAFGATVRVEISVPTGDDQSFAGDKAAVGIPSFACDLRRGRWLAAAELGARLRQTSDLLGARVGPQIFAGLGAGVHVVEPELFSILAEAVALPTFAEQHRVAYDTDLHRYVEWSTGQRLVPAEWAVSVRSVPWPQGDFSVGLSGGGRLPLTTDPGITTPVYRFSLALRYAPAAR
jgi:OmpA-OmpF porin, OOP family